MIRALLAVLAIAVSAVFGPGVAYAQTGGTVAYSGLAVLNRIINNTPGTSFVASGGSATVSASAAETVGLASSGLRVPIMVNASAGITAARLAGALGFAMKAGTVIGAATIILPWIAQQTGIKVCPPPDFFCKPGPPASVDPPSVPNSWRNDSGATEYYDSPKSFCDAALASYIRVQPNGSPFYKMVYPDSTHVRCDMYFGSNGNLAASNWAHATYVGGVVCPAGTTQSGGQCIAPGPDIPATQPDIANALPTPLSDQAKMQTAMDTARLSNVALLDATSPVTVTAPAVTTQPQTKTETITNPDGTTSTKVTTITTTITPTVSGSTIGNTTITYPASTTHSEQTTNNSTNVTTNYTYVTNEYATPQTPDKIDLPDDYNREATQRRIEADLNTDGAAKLPDQSKVITAATSDSDTKIAQMRTDAQNNMPTDRSSTWYSFLWTPPVGTCSPYVLNVGGNRTGTVDICDWVSKLRDVLGWLMALFASFTVWKLLFKGDS